MMFRFAEPYALLLLILPILFLFLRGRIGKEAAVRFPAIALAKQVSAFVRSRPGRFRATLRFLILTFLILALARPQTGEELSELSTSGVDIVLAVDLSTSMWAFDFEVAGLRQDRLTVVKRVLKDFVEARPSDRLGLIAFAGEAYLVSPLTLKHDWLLQRLDELEIGSIPDGTAIGSAIGSSVNRLVERASETKLVVLLTDGANNRGELAPLPAAEAASAFGIKIYTIGVGQPGWVPYPSRFDRDGRPMAGRDGQVLLANRPSDLDLKTLQTVAEMTEGTYFHATDTDELKSVYDKIDELEKTEVTYNVRRLFDDYFWIPLLAAFLFLIFEQILEHSKLRRLP
jgi:Ca-activated chloride channel family protein|tara:strand:- start:122026 stop:123054 length:1029 start_codon:yes stop_codon:yes gene_type:complete